MDHLVPVRRALISVSDKTDLVGFAKMLTSHGVTIVSTGGTAAALMKAGIKVTPIEELTGFPEMMDGRVKTLHPRVHGGLLARRNNPAHLQSMRDHGIESIDLVCVNLYPFEQTVRKEGIADEEAIEQIDIGGPSMIRSASKNFESVTVVTDPEQYDLIAREMSAQDGSTSLGLRRTLAGAAFARTASYDTAIASWFDRAQENPFPELLQGSWRRIEELRYGENPHQLAAIYADVTNSEVSIVGAPLLWGKPLSYNNVLDASAALEAALDLRDINQNQCAGVIVKHTNPCGAAMGATARDAFLAAYAGDPLAAYGGIVALTGTIDRACAEAIVEGERFLEVIVASAFDDDACALISSRWKNVRLVAVGPARTLVGRPLAMRTVAGGLLVQERDTKPIRATDLQHVAGPAPSAAAIQTALLACVVVKHLKSNAVCIAAGDRLLGAGAGQMDRVASCRIACDKATSAMSQCSSIPVAASDAFFPFSDGPELLIRAGVKCIAHPGGSKRDQETIDLCEQHGVTCLITGTRHFRH